MDCGKAEVGLHQHVRDLLFTEDIEESFHRLGVPNERLSAWVSKEAKLLGTPSDGVDHDLRKVALLYLHGCVQKLGMPAATVYESALLLDLYCIKTPDMLASDEFPSICIAILLLLSKFHSGNNYPLKYNWAQFGLVTEHALRREEAVLAATGWHLNLVSADVWFATFCIRFDTIAHSLYDARSREIIKAMGRKHIAEVTLAVSACILPPRVLALAIFANVVTQVISAMDLIKKQHALDIVLLATHSSADEIEAASKRTHRLLASREVSSGMHIAQV